MFAKGTTMTSNQVLQLLPHCQDVHQSLQNYNTSSKATSHMTLSKLFRATMTSWRLQTSPTTVRTTAQSGSITSSSRAAPTTTTAHWPPPSSQRSTSTLTSLTPERLHVATNPWSSKRITANSSQSTITLALVFGKTRNRVSHLHHQRSRVHHPLHPRLSPSGTTAPFQPSLTRPARSSTI